MKTWPDAARPNRVAPSNSIADVAVIGGGIVGAAAALAAAHGGLSTVWVAGRAAAAATVAPHQWDPRVYALSPATQRFLETLRVWAQLNESRVAPVFDMRIFGDSDGRSRLHFGAYEAATERLATIVEHAELARVLDTAAAYAPGIERIDGIASHVAIDADSVAVSTQRGMRQARLVIAADGAQSETRTAIGITARARPYGQRAVVGNFSVTHPHAGTAFQWFTDDGVIALLPLPGDAMSLVWSAPDAVAHGLLESGADGVAARLSTVATAVGPLQPIGTLLDVPLSLQVAHRMIAPRGALVGDAAHVIHPLAGQGLNLGLQDVETLVDVLASRESFRDCGDPVLLRRYERARAEPVFAMQQMTDGLARLFADRAQPVVGLRTLGLQVVDHLPSVKRLLMRQAAGNP